MPRLSKWLKLQQASYKSRLTLRKVEGSEHRILALVKNGQDAIKKTAQG
jgi:hypothetical protein